MARRSLLAIIVFTFVGAVSVLASFAVPANSYAVQSVPYQMNFQGRLNDSTGAPMPNGTYNMKFRIYSVLSGGSPLWSEQRSVFSGTGVTITTGGLFSVQLGSVSSLPPSIFNSATPLYLEVELPTPATATCSTSGCESYTEGAMTPRNPIASSPYAVNSDLLDGMDSSAFAAATGGTGYIQNQTAGTQSASFRINGTGSIQGSSATALQVQDASGTAVLAVDTTANTTNVIGNLNLVLASAPTSAPTTAAGAAGSLTGTFSYIITYVTASGETDPGPHSNVTVSAQQVNLTAIPTSPSNLVTARRIYRGTSSVGPFNLVATIADNTTTTYTDNATSLGATLLSNNSTASLLQNGAILLQADTSANTALGLSALANNAYGSTYAGNTAFGSSSLHLNTVGASNTASGTESLYSNTTGSENAAFGMYALDGNTTGSDNTALGFSSLGANTTGFYNTAVGSGALGSNDTGSGNIGLGPNALAANLTGSNNMALGYNAGNSDSTNAYFMPGTALQNTTAIGAYSIAQANNTLVLGSVDLGTKTVIGATVPVGTNLFGISPVDLNSPTITASQTSGSGTITASSAIFSSANVGEIFVWADGTTETVTAYADSTHITGSSTTTTESGQHFRTHRIGFQVTNTGNVYVQNASTTAFSIQNASGTSIFNADTTTNTLSLGSISSGDYLSFTASGGLVANGTARHTKTILLPAEYTGAVLDAASDAACSSANSGTMTSGYDSTNRMNYYNWTSISASAQCYDVVVQVPIPADFAGWSGTPDIRMMKDSTGTAAYALQIVPSAGTDANYNAYVSPGTLSTSWANMATSALSGTYTAGDYLTIKVRVSSTSSANVKLGNIKLTYYSSF